MQSYKDKANYHPYLTVFGPFSWQNRFFIIPLHTLTHKRLAIQVDSLAQSVEHFTFNEGVSGSNPERVTRQRGYINNASPLLFFYVYTDLDTGYDYQKIPTHRLATNSTNIP